jgi:hypothetical protein
MSNFVKAMTPRFSRDIPLIKTGHPILSRLTDIEIEKLWTEFSESASAQWLIPTADWLKDFKEWLEL